MIIVVPMAGRGSRFSGAGINRPKPLIDVNGLPMVFHALRSIEGVPHTALVFVVLEEHEAQYNIGSMVRKQFGSKAHVATVPDVTEGQLCTVLAAKDWFNFEVDVLVTSSDTFVVSAIGNDIANKPVGCKGIISVADLPGDRWSFARIEASGAVTEVAEKVRISPHASTGLYYFSCGRDLIETGEAMIRRGEKTRGEYYVIPVYQHFIEKGWLVTVSQAAEMWDMGTPEALDNYLKHKL